LLIEEEDYKTLRDSIDTNDAFDSLGLASRLEKHELLEFRRLAAHLYKKNSKWDREPFLLPSLSLFDTDVPFFAVSISLSKQDKLFKDAIETAATSASSDVADELLNYFVDIGSRECYTATLYVCYDLIRSDVAQYLSWKAGLNDFTMPYLLSVERLRNDQIAALQKQVKELSTRTVEKEEAENTAPILMGSGQLMLGYGGGY
jgi:clathrin heavy chain